MKRTISAIALSVFATISILMPQPARAALDRLLFGVVPQQSATRLAMIWVPLLERLSADTGFNIQFTTAKDIPAFEKCLSTGAYDLAYMNPYHYVEFHRDPGYEAFAHQRGTSLKGILVVRADSKIDSLNALEATDLAFPSPAAFGASVLPRAELRQRGIQFRPHYVKSHDSVYRAVVAGLYPAGGGVLRTFGSVPDAIKSQLRILYETKAYTPHAFAAHPRVDHDAVAIIRAAMAALEPDAEVLKGLGMKGIEPASDANWNDVRDLNLSRENTELVEGQAACRSD